jgi:hypothetical protein
VPELENCDSKGVELSCTEMVRSQKGNIAHAGQEDVHTITQFQPHEQLTQKASGSAA